MPAPRPSGTASAPTAAAPCGRPGRVGRVALPVVVATGAVGAATSLRWVDPGGAGLVTPCPVRAMTGVWCPGCGMTRSVHELLHGDVSAALSFNVLTPIVLGGLAALWFVWLRLASGAGAPAFAVALRLRLARPLSLAAAAVLVAAFVVLRNLPAAAVLRGG